MHVHLVVHLPSGSHTIIATLGVAVVHSERVSLSSRPALHITFLAVRGSTNLLFWGVHHLLIRVYIL